MRNKPLLLGLIGLHLSLFAFSLSIQVRSYDHDSFTRMVLEGDRPFSYSYDQRDDRIDIHLDERAEFDAAVQPMPQSDLIGSVVHHVKNKRSVFTAYLTSGYRLQRTFVLERPYRVVFDITGEGEAEPSQTDPIGSSIQPSGGSAARQDTGVSAPPQTSLRERRTREAIDTICIDAGHGGSDFGAVSPDGELKEKDITLKVASRLRRLIESRLGIRVLMTRDRDSEVSLDSRVALANNQKAHMFVSIHVNSSFRKGARGPETFFVSLKATDQEALELAQKENAVFGDLERITERDELKMILWNMAQTEYIRESSRLAEFVQSEMNVLMHTINRGVKQAPFRVLMRAAMPAVLLEVGFLSNPAEARRLSSEKFLDEVAAAIYSGMSRYIQQHNEAVE